MIVQLQWSEALLAAQAGVMRRMLHLKSRTHATYGDPADAWDVDVEGAAAELAVSKALGVCWTGAQVSGSDKRSENGAADAGGVQVRSTRHLNGCLILHNEDNDDDVFVLVVGRIPRFQIKGWIHGGSGKHARWWRTDRRHPAYFVPADALRPLGQLTRAPATAVGT